MTLLDLSKFIHEHQTGASDLSRKLTRVLVPEQQFCVLAANASSAGTFKGPVSESWNIRVIDRFWMDNVLILPYDGDTLMAEYGEPEN